MVLSVPAYSPEKRTDLHMKPFEVGHFLCKMSFIVDRAGGHLIRSQDTMSDGNSMVVFTEGRCLMNDTRYICVGDVSINKNSECFVFKLQDGRWVCVG